MVFCRREGEKESKFLFRFLEMGKKELRDEKVKGRVEAVLQLVKKHSPLTVKQVGFFSFPDLSVIKKSLREGFF